MENALALAAQYNQAAGRPRRADGQTADRRQIDRQLQTILTRFDELFRALQSGNQKEISDAIGRMLHVTLCTADMLEVDVAMALAKTHAEQMRRLKIANLDHPYPDLVKAMDGAGYAVAD
jgi:NTP pyrophosphatase (non-canonical NTP hydrolase)